MAAKNSTKSSKTAHVMNLLNKGRAHTPDGDAPSDASNGSPLDDMVDQPTTDQMISDQIKGALEEELGDTPAPPLPQEVFEEASAELEPTGVEASPQPEPAPTPVPMPTDEGAALESPSVSTEIAPPVPAAEAVSAPEPQPVPVEDTVPAPPSQPAPVEDTPPVPNPQPTPVEEAHLPPPVEEVSMPREDTAGAEAVPAESQSEDSPTPAPKEINCINVMQVLVEERAQKYIDMFGLCQCPRCVVDVKALALSNLPAKYVVMNKGEMVPRITIYESRYSTAITAQIMQACKVVMDSPRHDI